MSYDKIKGKQIDDSTIEQRHLNLSEPGFFDSNSAATIGYVNSLYLSGVTTGITSGTSGISGSSGVTIHRPLKIKHYYIKLIGATILMIVNMHFRQTQQQQLSLGLLDQTIIVRHWLLGEWLEIKQILIYLKKMIFYK